MFLCSSKIGRKIVGFSKNIFWELVLCIDVALVSKFYPIWCPITQESNLGRKGKYLVEICVFRDLPVDNVQSHRTISDLT
jgi:hypothetical protein